MLRASSSVTPITMSMQYVTSLKKSRKETSKMGAVTPLSKIEPHEEDEAKKLVADHLEQVLGCKFTGKVAGYMIGLKIYVRPEELSTITRDDGTTATLYRPM